LATKHDFRSLQDWQSKKIGHQHYGNQIFFSHQLCDDPNLVTNRVMGGIWSLILWQQNLFNCHSCGNKKLLVVDPAMTKSSSSPHEWQSKTLCCQSCGNQMFLVTIHMVIENFHFGSLSFDWWWIDLHHWFGNKIWCCLVIKNKPYAI